MECRMNIDNRKIKTRLGVTWVISAVKTFPILAYHELIMAWLALVAKNSVDKFETATLYKQIYYIPDRELKNESYTWYETFDQCKDDALCNAHMYHPDTQDAIHLYIYRWIVGTQPMLFYKRQLMTSQRK